MARRSFARVLVLLCTVALLLSIGTASAQTQPTTQAPVVGTVVGGEGVNIRDCPKTSCPVRAVAKLGEKITVTGPAFEWFLPVDWAGVTGFWYGCYVATPQGGFPHFRQGE